MVRWLGILLWTLRSSVRTHRELALENLALWRQLAVWKACQRRLQLRATDRILWAVLSNHRVHLVHRYLAPIAAFADGGDL